jgi:hypothetical protein
VFLASSERILKHTNSNSSFEKTHSSLARSLRKTLLVSSELLLAYAAALIAVVKLAGKQAGNACGLAVDYAASVILIDALPGPFPALATPKIERS